MKFTPKTLQALREEMLLNPGIYKFMVKDAKDETSQNGNQMIKVTLEVYDLNHKPHLVTDYLMASHVSLEEKLNLFSYSVGIQDKYNMGEIVSSDCINKKGTVEIVVKPPQPDKNDPSKTYQAKNVVKRYLINTEPPKGSAEFVNDDVPF